MKFVLCATMLMGLMGCSSTPYTDPVVKSENQARLSKEGEYVGTLPDGRSVERYWVSMGSDFPSHWIYVTKGSMTVNRTTVTTDSEGNQTKTHYVDVMIDGVPYTPEKSGNKVVYVPKK